MEGFEGLLRVGRFGGGKKEIALVVGKIKRLVVGRDL